MSVKIFCNRTDEDGFKKTSSILVNLDGLELSEEELELILFQIQSIFDKKDST